MESMRLSQQMTRVSTEMALRRALVNLANLEFDIKALDATISLNEESLRRVTLRHQFGRASDSDLRAAEQTLRQSRMNREALTINRSIERQALNRILQKPPDADTEVVYIRGFMEPAEDLASYIADKIGAEPVVRPHRLIMNGSEPSIQQRQLTLETKRIERDGNEDDDRKTHFDNEFNKALRELNDARRSMEAHLRAGSQNIDQLQKRQDTLAVDLEKAENQWQNTIAHLDRGLVTPYEVDQAALAVLNIEVAIEKNLNQLWLLEYTFLHPFLMG
jgi:outer membrane protein TolC